MLYTAIFIAFTKFQFRGYLTNPDCQARAKQALDRVHPEVKKEWEDHARKGGSFRIEGWLVYLNAVEAPASL